MSLSSSYPMKEADKFVGDGVFMKKGDLFDCVENNGSFKDGSIERENSMYGQEKRVN